MGFTALDSLPTGTRCGALDPGVVLHLTRASDALADGALQAAHRPRLGACPGN
jgi:acetate kinase